MFSWTMLISGNKLAEQIRSAVFGTGPKSVDDKDLREDEKNNSSEVKTLNS